MWMLAYTIKIDYDEFFFEGLNSWSDILEYVC